MPCWITRSLLIFRYLGLCRYAIPQDAPRATSMMDLLTGARIVAAVSPARCKVPSNERSRDLSQ